MSTIVAISNSGESVTIRTDRLTAADLAVLLDITTLGPRLALLRDAMDISLVKKAQPPQVSNARP